MPPTKTTSVLAAKYGKKLDAAVKAHANDQTTYGIINLPGGIKNGIARVSKCYFKEFDKNTGQKRADGSSAAGDYFFRVEGTVVSPESHPTPAGVIPVKGLVTSQMIPLCATKSQSGNLTSEEEQISRILNIMRQLAGPDYTNGATINDLESLAAGLEAAAPYFWFSTSESKPDQQGNTRVFENWQGNRGLEDYQPEVTSNFKEGAPASAPSANGHPKTPAAAPQTPTQSAPASGEEQEESLDDLLALASSDADSSIVAQERLTEMAREAGYSDAEISAETVSWEDVVAMIQNPKTDSNAPAVGSSVKYSPPSKKQKGVKLAERDCKVEAVDTENQTADLLDLTNKQKYAAVLWADIEYSA